MTSAVAGEVGSPGSRRAGVARLSLRKVYILPTRQGVGFAFMLAVMLLGAVNYDNGLAHLLVFTLAALALVSVLHTYRNLAHLRVRAAPSRPVFAGSPVQLAVVVEEPGARARHDIIVRDAQPALDLDAPGASTLGSGIAELHLGRGETGRVEIGVASHQRGWLRRERVLIASRFPFGLFRAWSEPRVELACLVYPAPAEQVPPIIDSAESEHDGDHHAAGEEDFAGLREYTPGDSPRRVHWKAAARSDELRVKRFEGAAPAEAKLDYGALRGDVESRLSQLAALVLEAEHAGLRYSLALPGRAIPAGAGPAHQHDCLAALALFDTGAP